MFQDEAGFGRINKPKYCWCQKGIRPSVPCHHIREYRYAYGAVEPKTGDSFFLIMPYCNTDCMNLFLQELSKQFVDDVIVLALITILFAYFLYSLFLTTHCITCNDTVLNIYQIQKLWNCRDLVTLFIYSLLTEYNPVYADRITATART